MFIRVQIVGLFEVRRVFPSLNESLRRRAATLLFIYLVYRRYMSLAAYVSLEAPS